MELARQIKLGEELTDEAIARVTPDEEWMRKALKGVLWVCLKHDRFTTDEVWSCFERMKDFSLPKEPRAMGAVMRRACSQGLCRATSETKKSVRPECHRRPLTVWQSEKKLERAV